MDTSAIIAIVVVIVVLVVAVLVARPLMRRRRLRERFGPEYDRALESHDNRAVAERDLIEREKRYRELDQRPLAPEARDRYAAQWTQVQAQFVDEPEGAVTEADRLVTIVMRERGYPTEGFEQQLADLSVEHANTLEHYRAAHHIRQGIGTGETSTEDLRNAMVHYRELFVDLLERGTDSDGRHAAGDRWSHDGVADGRNTDDRMADRHLDDQYRDGRHGDQHLDDRHRDDRLTDDQRLADRDRVNADARTEAAHRGDPRMTGHDPQGTIRDPDARR